MTTVELTPVPLSLDAEAAEFAAGFRRVQAEILGVGEGALVPVNVDAASAVATVLGALPEIRAFRGDVSELPGFDLVRFDRLRDYALALGHAHAAYRAASGPPDGVSELAEEVASIRDVLRPDAGAAAALRQRAFTLLALTYDEARRAIAYLRWHESDAEHIAPSLHALRAERNALEDSPTVPDVLVQ